MWMWIMPYAVNLEKVMNEISPASPYRWLITWKNYAYIFDLDDEQFWILKQNFLNKNLDGVQWEFYWYMLEEFIVWYVSRILPNNYWYPASLDSLFALESIEWVSPRLDWFSPKQDSYDVSVNICKNENFSKMIDWLKQIFEANKISMEQFDQVISWIEKATKENKDLIFFSY